MSTGVFIGIVGCKGGFGEICGEETARTVRVEALFFVPQMQNVFWEEPRRFSCSHWSECPMLVGGRLIHPYGDGELVTECSN